MKGDHIKDRYLLPRYLQYGNKLWGTTTFGHMHEKVTLHRFLQLEIIRAVFTSGKELQRVGFAFAYKKHMGPASEKELQRIATTHV